MNISTHCMLILASALLLVASFTHAHNIRETDFIKQVTNMLQQDKLLARNAEIAFVNSVIIYRETDRNYRKLSADMYSVLEKKIGEYLKKSAIDTIECIECKVYEFVQTDKFVKRKIKLSNTSELLNIAHDLQANHVLVWGILVGTSPIIYFRFLDATNGRVTFTHFIYD